MLLIDGSFGTVVDAGQGVNVLFDLLVDLNTPFVFAGGNQLSSLPQSTRHKIQESVGKGQAIAPEWCDQVGILHHPVSPLERSIGEGKT